MARAAPPPSSSAGALIDKAGVLDSLNINTPDEGAWIEVIQKMDSVYADLVRSQVELEKNNAALEDAQRFISSVLASMTDILIVCDIDGIVQQGNAALERITGKPGGEICGRHLLSIFTEEAAPLVMELPEKIRSGQSVIDCELSLTAGDGEAVPLSVNCTSRYNSRGKLVGLVLIGRPVGELRRAYEELDKAHHRLGQAQQKLILSEKMAALGRLVAGVAHELNNPISFVFGNMHALQRYGKNITRYLNAIDEMAEPAELKALRKELKIDRIAADLSPLVEGTLEGAERVNAIVHDLRRYFSGQEERDESFDLPAIIRTASRWVIKTNKNAPAIDFELPPALQIISKKGHIHQIIVNLVQNGVDVMEGTQSPRLVVSCGQDSNGIFVHVRDFGPGMGDDVAANIFEPFYTTKPIGKGTGLGLYVSYGLAEDLGGSLRAKNHCEGGAVFSLNLPLEVLHEQ